MFGGTQLILADRVKSHELQKRDDRNDNNDAIATN